MSLRSVATGAKRALVFVATIIVQVVGPGATARADELGLGSEGTKKRSFVIESVETALTAYEQNGYGYQSKAGPLRGPGSQRLTVFQPQVLVLARQNDRIVHRFWMPLDIITSASADATDKGRKPPDMLSQASRQNQAVTFDWLTAYEAPRRYAASARNGVHVEENFRSWSTGVAATASLADDSATVSANANQIFDWFARYDTLGHRRGRTSRSTSNANVGVTQILTPTTVVHANYGMSLQYGEISNTWASVPSQSFEREREILPHRRVRHAVVGRFAQFLPWNGALKGFYRFYADGWGITAHAAEGQLLQRLSPLLYIRGSYRFYTQTAARFFTTLAEGEMTFQTADSDLGSFDSHTVGFKLAAEVPFVFRGAHVDAGYERYWRTDGLTVNVALWQAGARF